MGCCLLTRDKVKKFHSIDMKNILDSNDAGQLAQELHQLDRKIVLVGGCFDILHIGHIALLQGAKACGDILVVLLESDSSIIQRKGKDRPLHTQMQRAKVLAALRAVDYVILLPPNMTNLDYDTLTKLLQPAIIATTENDPGLKHKKRQATHTGARIVFVNKPIQDISTSRIVAALQKEL